MTKWIKKALLILLTAFLLFFLFTRPEGAANAVRSVGSAFESLIRFFESLAA